MSGKETLSEILLSATPARNSSQFSDRAALDRRLTALWESGRSAWPGVALSAPAFVQKLAAHLSAEEDAENFFRALHASDLYLAGACAQGDSAALASFDRSILSQVPSFVSRMDPSPAFADEIRQLLREKLLLAAAGAPPKIAEYSGTGTLWSWVRVVAIRTAVSLRRNRDEQPKDKLDEFVAKALPLGRDLEVDYIRTRYQNEFKEALRAAFASLPQEQRHVLRLHFAGGLTGDAIAAMLQVNRRTVVRWLGSAKTAMLHETRRLLQARLHLSPGELDSLVRMVNTSFDLSLSTLLKSGDTPA
jgi:RNA polymerase sigma-70 factor (ECF subfamily)